MKEKTQKWFNDLQSRIADLQNKSEAEGLTRGELCQLFGMIEVLELHMERVIENYDKMMNLERVEEGKRLLENLKESRRQLVAEMK